MKSVAVIVAVAAAVALAAVGFARGTYAAGGSDSSCYALMADALALGALQPTSALEPKVPWPDAPKTFAPGGFVPSQSQPAASAPVCAPGFSVLLAPLVKIGGRDALFAATPIAGALLVWLAFLGARALGGPIAGAMAAVLIATSPVLLFQVVQPMNDVTTAMLWMAVFALLACPEPSMRIGWAGVCCGLALLVRPNLLPLAIVAGGYVLVAGPGLAGRRFSRALIFAAGAAPFLFLILWLNRALYGGALRSGYGHLDSLFSVANVPANAKHYLGWLLQTQTILVLLGALAPRVVPKGQRGPVWLALALIASTAGIYVAYTRFDDWSYLRFLLPAIGLLIVLMSVVLVRASMLLGGRASFVFVAIVTLTLALNGVAVARDRLAFQMRALEQRYRSAGIVVRDQLPAGAAILTTWDSGAIRFHGRKEAIVWDALDPAWLDRAVAWLSDNGRQPFILVESWEEPRFRARFGGSSPLGNLDWPPKYEVDRVVRIYDPADRGRYTNGQRVVTQYLWPLMEGKK
jgi:hypothetical protein